jgi:hypothetical protein
MQPSTLRGERGRVESIRRPAVLCAPPRRGTLEEGQRRREYDRRADDREEVSFTASGARPPSLNSRSSSMPA